MFKKVPKKSALEKEWEELRKKEENLLSAREKKKESKLNQFLAEKVPDKLQGTLDLAFAKAFSLIFEKGTGVIEKTYKREIIEQEYKINEFTAEVKQNRKSLRKISKKASSAGTANLVISGTVGIGMGLVGVGIPDIPVFTSLVLKNIYEIALNYGFGYETIQERYFVLRLIETAVSHGEQMRELDHEINRFIAEETLPEGYRTNEQVKETAGSLSKELLYMKFLQGTPIVGTVGGAYDVIYMKQITEYAKLKYKRRFLHDNSASRKKLPLCWKRI